MYPAYVMKTREPIPFLPPPPSTGFWVETQFYFLTGFGYGSMCLVFNSSYLFERVGTRQPIGNYNYNEYIKYNLSNSMRTIIDIELSMCLNCTNANNWRVCILYKSVKKPTEPKRKATDQFIHFTRLSE